MNKIKNNILKYVTILFCIESVIIFITTCILLVYKNHQIIYLANYNFLTLIIAAILLAFITITLFKYFKLKFSLLWTAIFIVDAYNLILVLNPILDIVWIILLSILTMTLFLKFTLNNK